MGLTYLFDDVAFVWFLECLLACVLIPPTAWWILGPVLGPLLSMLFSNSETKVKGGICGCSACVSKKRRLRQSEKSLSKNFSVKHVVFAFLWALFFYMLYHAPALQEDTLMEFDPYKILDVEVGSTEAQINKAYRKGSLVYHPDKNPGNATAEHMFVMLSKAKKVLLDPATRENWEKYGNPDGYQGASVTIGLPSFLTTKENGLLVLVLYAFAMIALVIGVGLWWRHQNQFHKTGLMNETIFMYWKFVTPEMSLKYLIEIIAASVEFKQLGITGNQQSVTALQSAVKDKMVKQKFDKHPYIVKGSVLMHSHLLQEPIPDELAKDWNFVLEKAPTLIGVLLEMCLGRNFFRPALALVNLSQLLTQGLWTTNAPVEQLPHITGREAKLFQKKKMDLVQFVRASKSQRRQVLKDAELSEEQLQDIDEVCEVIPDVDLRCSAETEGEDHIVEGDIATISVSLERFTRHGEEEEEMVVIEKERKKQQQREMQDKESDELETTNAEEFKDDSELPDAPSRAAKRVMESYEPHCPNFPYKKKERWIVLLIDKQAGKIVHMRFLTSLVGKESIQMKIMAPPTKGVYHYELMALCDSYTGVQKQLAFKLHVDKKKTGNDVPPEESLDNEDMAEDERALLEQEEVSDPKWYYLYCDSFLELLVNVVVMYFAWLVLLSSSIGQQYLQPVVDEIYRFSAEHVYDFGDAPRPEFPERHDVYEDLDEEFDYSDTPAYETDDMQEASS